MSAENTKAEESVQQGESAIPLESGTAQPTLSADEAKTEALRQIEFYFHDSNLPFDKFLFTLTRKDPEGWVPISTIASFKRMRSIKDQIGIEGIAEALKGSKDLLDVSEDGVNVRRKKELVPVMDAFDRSVYAKGFGEEHETLQKDLESFFGEFGKINSVRMRRDMESASKPKPFKSSVFVEFADAEDRTKFLAKAAEKEPEQDGGKAITFQDKELLVMSKDAYVKMKMKEKGIDPSNQSRRGGDSAGPSQKKFNAFKEMSKKDGRGSEFKDSSKPKRSDPLEFEYNGNSLTTRPDGTVDPEAVKFPSNSVLKFSGAGEGGNWKDLKDTLVTLHPTSFVEFPNGAVEGAVGFKETLSSEKLQEIKDKKITVGGNEVTFELVDEPTAKNFYLERANFRASGLLDKREEDGGRGGRGNSRGGRGGGRGRGGKSGRGGGGGRGGFGRGDKRKRNDHENGSSRDNAPPSIGKKAKTADN